MVVGTNQPLIPGGQTIKYAVINDALSPNNTIVAAVVDKKIRVISLFLVAGGTVIVRFEGGASGTALSGQMKFVVNGNLILPYNVGGWFETAENVLLNIELNTTVSIDGSLTYIEV